jgi:TonB-linked SusC/RagA family outer membrane protein
MKKCYKMCLCQRAGFNAFLAGTKWLYCFLLLFWGISSFSSISAKETFEQQQNKTKVSGTVKDESGEPLIGVTITIQGQTKGTVTDIDGKYSLEAPSPSVLIVSYVGYKKQQLNYKGQSNLNIQMEADVSKLDEVVCIGYGAQKKKNVTGSMATVDMEIVKDIPTMNLASALEGQIAGLNIDVTGTRPGDNGASFEIRQTYSFSKDGGNTNPLIIVDDVVKTGDDGLPSTGALTGLDPNQIESITVLRDASAAIYGARAANGAIIIKTKRGKEGKVRISYSGKYEWNDAISHDKLMSTYQFGQFYNSMSRNSLSTSINKEELRFSDAELEQMKGLNYDWLGNAWKGAGSMSHSVNVSGGSKNATYFFGASIKDAGANLGIQDSKSYGFRSGCDINLTPSLKLSASLNTSTGTSAKLKNPVKLEALGGANNSQGGIQDYSELLHMPGYIPMSTNVNGTDYWVAPTFGNMSTAGKSASSSYWTYYGLKDGNTSINKSESLSWGTNLSLQYDVPFIKGLSVKASYAFNRSGSKGESYTKPYQLAYATNMNGDANSHLYTDNTTWGIQTVTDAGVCQTIYTSDYSKSYQSNLFLTYERDFGPHSISAMASIEKSSNYGFGGQSRYTGTSQIYNGSSTSAGTLDSDYENWMPNEGGTMSYLGRISYAYKNKYLAQFIGRADASTKFAPENYWGFFPSLSVGWVMSEEPWFKEKVKWIDFLKIRFSVGKTGNDNLKVWRWLQMYNYRITTGSSFGTTNGGNYGAGLIAGVVPNRDAHWDSHLKYNFGFDISMLDNRLSITNDWYFNHVYDQFTAMASTGGFPISMGAAFADANYASTNAWGTDFSISWRDKIGQVNYSVSMNTGFGWDKVMKYPYVAANFPANISKKQGMTTIQPTWIYKVWKGNAGQDGLLRSQSDIDSYWQYLTDHANAVGGTPSYFGKAKSYLMPGMLAYQDLAGSLQADGNVGAPDGKITDDGADKGKATKTGFKYGFSTSFRISWKNFNWSANLSTSWGGFKSLDYSKQKLADKTMLWNQEIYWTDMFDPVTNPNGKYPNMGIADYIQKDCDFWQIPSFRCYVRSMVFSYTLPSKLIAKVGLSSASVNVAGNNLWDFYNPYPHHYTNMYDGGNVGFPKLRTWSLGLNVSF